MRLVSKSVMESVKEAAVLQTPLGVAEASSVSAGGMTPIHEGLK